MKILAVFFVLPESSLLCSFFPADSLSFYSQSSVFFFFFFFCVSLFIFFFSKSRNYVSLFISVSPQRACSLSFRGDPRSVLVRFRKQLAAARGRSYFSVSRYQRSLTTTNIFFPLATPLFHPTDLLCDRFFFSSEFYRYYLVVDELDETWNKRLYVAILTTYVFNVQH